MRTSLECVVCFVRQALDSSRFVTDDQSVHEMLLRKVLAMAAEMDMSTCPPAMAQQIHRTLREATGIANPYAKLKTQFNNMALAMLDELEGNIASSSNPFYTASRLAIAGNVIDFGVSAEITEDAASQSVRNALDEPFYGDVDNFRSAAAAAQSILYLADNAGEIVFDRLLLAQLPQERVTLAVRGAPIINDATMADAEAASITDLVEVIDNGDDAPGTILSQCSEQFRKKFAAADLIIAKGQGNFETLSGDKSNIFFLFKVKCPAIAAHVGQQLGTHVLMHSPKGKSFDG